MIIATQEIHCQGESLLLSNQRALFWPKERMLVLADLHLGKTAHFRKHGMAIPATVMHKDLERLSALIHHFGVRKLVVVGDMFHAGHNSDLPVFAAWRKQFPELEVCLVKGNHDRLKAWQYEELGIDRSAVHLRIGPFHFSHEQEPCEDGICISGHLHPGKVIAGPGRQTLRLPCFIVGRDQLVLPAFSLFSGLDTKNIPEGPNRFFLLTGREVLEWKE